MAEYAQWVIEDMAPFAMYALALLLLFMLFVILVFAFAHIMWIANAYATTRANLLADKLEERADAEFDAYCETLDSERDNG